MSAPQQHTDNAFHRARSRCIDAFALAERNAVLLLHKLDVRSGTEPFKEKLDRLAKSANSATVTPQRKSAVTELALLLPVRADIVHAPLTVTDHDGLRQATFANPAHNGQPGQLVRLLSLADFNDLQQRVEKLAKDLAD